MSDIDDAIQMLGAGYSEPAAIIEEPRRRLVMGELPGMAEQDTAAWVKLSTAFKPHIKELKGAPLAVWLFLSLSINREGVAFPGIRTMADQLGYSHQGVLDAIAILEQKGYLKVTRGQKKYNLYEPEFASIGRGKEPVNSLDSKNDESTFTGNESTFLPDESTFSAHESTPLDLNKSNKSNKNQPERKFLDPIDHALSFKAASQKAQVAIQIESAVKVRLGMEATSTKNGMKFVEYAVKKHMAGEDYNRFIDWYLANTEKKYRSFNNMIEKWPGAFPAQEKTQERENENFNPTESY